MRGLWIATVLYVGVSTAITPELLSASFKLILVILLGVSVVERALGRRFGVAVAAASVIAFWVVMIVSAVRSV